MERQIKVVLRENPSRHRQEQPMYRITSINTTIHMDKVVIRIGTSHQDQQQHSIRTITWNRKIPIPWKLTEYRKEDLLSNVTSAKSLGTWWKTVMHHSTYGIWLMKSYMITLIRLKWPRRTERPSGSKSKRRRSFPVQLSECISTEAAELFQRAWYVWHIGTSSYR